MAPFDLLFRSIRNSYKKVLGKIISFKGVILKTISKIYALRSWDKIVLQKDSRFQVHSNVKRKRDRSKKRNRGAYTFGWRTFSYGKRSACEGTSIKFEGNGKLILTAEVAGICAEIHRGINVEF